MRIAAVVFAIAIAFLTQSEPAHAQTGKTIVDAEGGQPPTESPWLLVPLFSVSPKLGTSIGGMVGYMHHFDEKSQLSMLGVNAQYTSTGSVVGGLFGKASWDEDHHRLV